MKILKKKNMLEFLGSFFYLFLGCLLEILVFHFLPINNFILEIFLIAIGFAVPFFLIYSILNEFNVVEINPVFTFSLWLRNQLSYKSLFLTMFSQFLGGLTAGFLLLLIFPKNISSLVIGYDNFSMFHTPLNIIILIEFLFSFLFVFCFLISKDKKELLKLKGLFLGGILFLILFFSIPYTSGCVNPIRSIVANIFVNFDSLRQTWIYILTSFAGSVFATTIYHIYFQVNKKVSLQHFL